MERALAGSQEIDLDYLGQLSTDAYPEIKKLRRHPDPYVRRRAESALDRIRVRARVAGWQSWNLSRRGPLGTASTPE